MSNFRTLTLSLFSLALTASFGAACGHDELLGVVATGGSTATGGVAGAATGGTTATGGVAGAASGGTTASGGVSGTANDASPDGLAGSAGSVNDASSDALADASDAAADSGDAMAAVVPDFKLVDENPSSALSKQQVSPRDYLGQVSAWYFGHST